LFFLLFYWIPKKEHFTINTGAITNTCNINIRNVAPLHRFHEFDGKWQNHLTNSGILHRYDSHTPAMDNLQPLLWKDLNWTNKENCLKKNKDFSISFWLFLSEKKSDYWTEIFNVYAGYDRNWYDRCPGVFLWPTSTDPRHGGKALHIRCNTDGSTDNWWELENIKASNAGNDANWSNFENQELTTRLPILTPVFIVISFSANGYTYYANDNAPVQSIVLPRPPADLGEKAYFRSTYSYRGQSYANNTFCMKDLCIYEHGLTTEEAQCVYLSNKHNSDICGANEKLGISTTGCIEGFTTLTSWMYSYENLQEPFTSTSYLDMLGFKDLRMQPESSLTSSTVDIPGQTFTDNSARTLTYRRFDKTKKNYIQVPNQIQYGDNGVTFCLWFNASISTYETDTNMRWSRLFDFGSGPGKDNVICAFLNGCLQFYVVHDWAPNDYANWEINNIADGNWHHLAWSLHKNEKKWCIYINGGVPMTLNDKSYPAQYDSFTGTVEFFQHYNYEGWKKTFQITSREPIIRIDDVKKFDMVGISSIKIPVGITIIMYDQTNYRGNSKVRNGEYTNSALSKKPGGWNDRINSLVIERTSYKPSIRTNQYIGRSNWDYMHDGKRYDDYYDGLIGDMRIYNKALSDEEVRTVFKNLPLVATK